MEFRFIVHPNGDGFAPKLDIDRYTVGQQTQDYVVGVRELDQNKLTGNQTNWINEHTFYTHGFGFVAGHGPCAPSMAFRVVDAKQAYARALALGAEPADIPAAQKTLDVPAIKGIGGSLLYFVDCYGAKGSAYDAEFGWLAERNPQPEGAGLFYLDHLTHNVHRGRMNVWTGFYE